MKLIKNNNSGKVKSTWKKKKRKKVEEIMIK